MWWSPLFLTITTNTERANMIFFSSTSTSKHLLTWHFMENVWKYKKYVEHHVVERKIFAPTSQPTWKLFHLPPAKRLAVVLFCICEIVRYVRLHWLVTGPMWDVIVTLYVTPTIAATLPCQVNMIYLQGTHRHPGPLITPPIITNSTPHRLPQINANKCLIFLIYSPQCVLSRRSVMALLHIFH